MNTVIASERSERSNLTEKRLKKGYIYILANKSNTVLYTGVTSDLKKRIYEHKEKLIDGFTKKYRVDHLVYYECYDDIVDAISREKQIKSGSRNKKILLIESMNKGFEDLYNSL